MSAPLSASSAQLLATLVTDYERWARECFAIRDKDDRLTTLRLRQAQRDVGRAEADALRLRGRARIFLLKARQGGFTTDQQGRNLWTAWRRPGSRSMTLAHAQKDTERIFEITRRAIDHFPKGLLPRLGDKATNEISFPGLDSFFYTGTAGAKRTGRGLTLTRLHGSEFCFWDAPKRILNSISPALERPGTTIVLESTASGYGSEAHEFWNDAVAGKNGYTPVFYPWWVCDPEHYRVPLDAGECEDLTEEEASLVTAHGLDREQIQWRRQTMATMGRDEFLQEYAEDSDSCWLAVGGLFYEASDLKRLRTLADARPVVRTDLNGALEIYVDDTRRRIADGLTDWERLSNRVVIGADTAEGVGGDASTFEARTMDGTLILDYLDRGIDPIAFAGILNEWGKKLGGAYLIVEKNMHGITTLRTLRDVYKYPTDRLYHRRALDKTTTTARQDRIGWVTSEETKPLLLDGGRDLIRAVLDGSYAVPSARVVKDMFGVRRGDNGKVELTGKDSLVAALLAWQGRKSFPTLTIPKPLHYS